MGTCTPGTRVVNYLPEYTPTVCTQIFQSWVVDEGM